MYKSPLSLRIFPRTTSVTLIPSMATIPPSVSVPMSLFHLSPIENVAISTTRFAMHGAWSCNDFHFSLLPPNEFQCTFPFGGLSGQSCLHFGRFIWNFIRRQWRATICRSRFGSRSRGTAGKLSLDWSQRIVCKLARFFSLPVKGDVRHWMKFMVEDNAVTDLFSSSTSSAPSRSADEYHGLRSLADGAKATPFSVSAGAFLENLTAAVIAL